MTFRRILPVFFLFCLIKVSAQTEQYLVKKVNLQSGGAQHTVHSIMQDKKGYLWFGTANGLNRYDGYDFKVFSRNVNDTNSISDKSVLSLYEDNDGIIWIGTVDGYLNKLERKTGNITRYDLRLSDKYSAIPEPSINDFPVPLSRNNENSVMSIADDKGGNLWIGTWGTGIIRFDKKSGRHFRYIENSGSQFLFKTSKNNIKTIFIDSDKNIWIGSMLDGLRKMIYDKQNDIVRFVRYGLLNGQVKQLTSILEDKDKGLLLGTFDGGFLKLSREDKNRNRGTIKINSLLNEVKIFPGAKPEKIMTMLLDKAGNVWLGTFGALLKYNPQKKELTRIEIDSQPSSGELYNILSLLEDRTGIIWVGFSFGGGVAKIEYNKIKFNLINKKYPLKNSLNNETIWSVYLDKKDVLWIGTERGGLNKYERKNNRFTYYQKNGKSKNSISDNCVRAIKEDKWGDLWLGTYSGGLNHFNKSTGEFRAFKFDSSRASSISHNQVQAIYIDSANTFWVGTFGGGLNKFQLKNRYGGEELSFTHYKHDKNDPFSLSSDKVYSIYQDKNKNMWIGTFDGGLNKFDKKTGRFIAYKNIQDDETSLEDNRVMAIYEDLSGNLWVATYGGGLNKFDPTTEKFTRFHTNVMSVVYAVLEDENKNLWMSSDKGIFKFNIPSKHYTQYHIDDGVQGLEFSGGAYYKSSNGEMFFGGTNGINYFFPNKITDNFEKPPVVISDIRVFNESIKAEKDVIELSYSENYVTFEFSALDFTSPADNRYSFMLEGYDKNWIPADSRGRLANYINLTPGTYTFKVRGTNSDDVWNNEGESVILIIKPMYWQTTWFRGMAILAFIGVLYYLFTLKYKGLLEMEKLKTKIAADLHDNVGAGLTEISILSELTSNLVSMGNTDSAKNLEVISEKSRALVDSMSDIVWVVNPKRDSLYDLILRLKDSYSDTFSAMGIAFKTNNLEEFSAIKLPMDYKQNLYLVFKEALNNSIKHSKCRQISLDAHVEKDFIELVLKDDGEGFDLEKRMRGNGLVNIRNRAKQVNGILEIESSEKGTSIKFIGKIKKIDKIKLLFKKF